MRKVQEVLRLLLVCGLSQRQASRVSGMARASVAEYLVRAQRAGLLETKEWESLSREDLEQRLYPPAAATTVRRERPEVSWQEVHEELRRKGMTLSLIWEEYRERCPEGYQYSRFCELYREWRGKLDLSMRQSHRAGEKLFVDYCGDTVSVVDGGQVRQAQVFVAVWGASSYTFAEATWSQGLPDWSHSHVRAFEFGGGLTELVVPDNLRSGVTRACRYEPEINPTYQDLAVHYGVAVIPARVRKPRRRTLPPAPKPPTPALMEVDRDKPTEPMVKFGLLNKLSSSVPLLPPGSLQTRPEAAIDMVLKLLTLSLIFTATGTLQPVIPGGTTKAIWSSPVQHPERPA